MGCESHRRREPFWRTCVPRAREGVARTLSKREIEERLNEILRHGGESAIQRLRDDARAVAGRLELTEEFRRIDALIGALLGSRDAALESPVAAARAAGLPYDPHRLDLFQRLFTELAGTAPVTRLARPTDGPALPFFEAYFSNFIEGTEFAVDEAADIVFHGTFLKRDRKMPMMCWARGEWYPTRERG